MSGATDPAAYRDDVPLRRVAVVVVCDVPAVTSQDAARITELTVLRALAVAPNRLRRATGVTVAVRALAHAVDELRGDRSTRVVADLVGTTSHTTVADLVRGTRVPSWPMTRDVVRALGGDEAVFLPLWHAATVARDARVTLRHLVDDRLDDPRDVRVVAVEDLRFALRADRPLVALVPLGEPEPPHEPEESP